MNAPWTTGDKTLDRLIVDYGDANFAAGEYDGNDYCADAHPPCAEALAALVLYLGTKLCGCPTIDGPNATGLPGAR